LVDVVSQSFRCRGCGSEVALGLLACPACKRLLYSEQLKDLATQAESAMQSGDFTQALTNWRHALELLPANTKQHEIIANKVDELSRKVDQQPSGQKTSDWRKPAKGLGIGALILSLLAKAKLLLLGLTKAGTILTMLLAFGVYWTAWGWKFAFGLIACIYVHEMGHVYRLQKFGIKATAPMFIPGFGALVRLKQIPINPIEDSRIGLAGPIWGLGAAVAVYLLHLATGNASLAGIAQAAAWINLFNLLPIWQLDGGRGQRSLNKIQRWTLVVLTFGIWYFTKEGMLLMIGILSVVNSFTKAPDEPDYRGFAEFAFLIAALSALCLIPVPGLAK
jgi:Zn-dependent protease